MVIQGNSDLSNSIKKVDLYHFCGVDEMMILEKRVDLDQLELKSGEIHIDGNRYMTLHNWVYTFAQLPNWG